MAAVIKAINAKIRSNKVADYVCSTHFWGPVSNFGIPFAAVMDTQKDPEMYVLNARSRRPYLRGQFPPRPRPHFVPARIR
ncbi:unnamed protein product [Penicillium manginii]